jgi:hypothetical protein
MSKYKTKLARIGANCCEQVMPVAVIPICSIACGAPVPIVSIAPCPPPPEPLPYPTCPEPAQYPTPPPPKQYPVFPTRTPESTGPCPTVVPLQILEYCEDKTYPAGTIVHNTLDQIPEGFLECNGATLSQYDYPQLFYVIGTYYGSGGSPTTFALPNIKNDCDTSAVFMIKT